MEKSYFDKKGNIINFYTIFNLHEDAGISEIKTSFRNLIKQYHPDTSRSQSERDTEKIDIIIKGYRILTDELSRREYDRFLFFNKQAGNDDRIIISKKRIKYSSSLQNMLKANLLPKGVKRKDIIYNFGQDIEIFITPIEASKGATAYIELPAKMHCPLCIGSDPHCYICKGIGRINTSSQLEVRIPPHVDDSTMIDVDLLQMKPDKMTSFCLKNLKIKIVIIDDA